MFDLHLEHRSNRSNLKSLLGRWVGSPFAYIPLAIQLPSHVRELRNRQLINNSGQMFFPAEKPVPLNPPPLHIEPPAIQESAPAVLRTDSPPAPVEPLRLISTPEPSKTVNGVVVEAKSPPSMDPPHSESLEAALGLAISSPLVTVPRTIELQPAPQNNNPLNQAKTSESHPIKCVFSYHAAFVNVLTHV